ncbi:MAG: hypothetical protein AB7U82_11245 [Blastocatellales bacterium]
MTGIARVVLTITLSLALGVATSPANAQATPQGQPYVAEYYYKTKWGYADEFLQLFKKNHLPVLKKQIESGRIVSVKIEKPRYHSTEDGRWDYRVTIVFKSAAAFHDPNASSNEEAIIKQLYPDQAAFKREEQRRFEILIAHWDVPIVPVE